MSTFKKPASIALATSMAFFCLLQPVFALDWVPSGQNIYYNGGKVGIGTANPSALLHTSEGNSGVVTPHAGGNDLFIEDDFHSGMTIGSPNDKSGNIMFADPEDNLAGRISYDHSSNALRLFTNGDHERMRIDSSGKVGIGTNSPTANLEIRGNSGTGAGITQDIVNDNAAYATQLRLLGGGKDYGMAFVYNKSINVSQISTRNNGSTTARMTFSNETGNIGVGTANPTEKLEVAGNLKISGNIVSDGDICIGQCN